MNNFITNTPTKSLSQRIQQLVSRSKELKFLSGFFYFSGLKELYESLKSNDEVIMKVLAGLFVDEHMYDLIDYQSPANSKMSAKDIANIFLNCTQKTLNHESFDNKDFYEQIYFFLELLKNDRLIIRKTKQPAHAKLYFFNLKDEEIVKNKIFITGSSNLTKYGLLREHEFNVEISDYGVEEAEAYFDNLWENSVKISEDNVIKTQLIDIIENQTFIKKITPFEAYLFVLKQYLDTYKDKKISDNLISKFEENNYRPYKYQLDAIKQALNIIELCNGVILADVVGLGKTIIACAIAHEIKKRGIVIAPPALIGDRTKTAGWNKYLEDFGLSSIGWQAYSSGILEEVLKIVENTNDIEVIIVDEAHRYRNQDTKSYELLRRICQGKIVILLTATPFNNKPSDIFSLLKLFIIPKKSPITLDDNIELYFSEFKTVFYKLAYIKKYHNSLDNQKRDKAKSYYNEYFNDFIIDIKKVNEKAKILSKQIRSVIEPVVIRRNRLDLKNNPNYSNEIKELSELEKPIEWFYELNEEQLEFYDEVLKEYFVSPDEGGRFTGAIYMPFKYEKGIKTFELDNLDESESFQYHMEFNLYDIMRRLLVKRFESSFGAFYQSLLNFKDITEKVYTFIKKTNKYILDRNLIENIVDKDLDEIEVALKEYSEKLIKNEYSKIHKIYELEKFKEKDKFIKDIEHDIEMFQELIESVDELQLVNDDPKLKCLITNIKKSLQKEPKRKIVIFSEYVDTIKYLQPKIEKIFGNRVLTIAGTLNNSLTEKIYKNFDASYKDQDDDYDILLTSDKLSEGVNLNRAGMVINYDIPWNPVRVIQRVGRINRISKKVFDKLYIINFFPTEIGSDYVKSREIAASKMLLIHNAIGEDAQIFDIDEEPTPSELYDRLNRNPDEIEEESFYTRVINEYNKFAKKYPDIIKKIENLPNRIKVAKKANGNELFVFMRKSNFFVFHTKYDDNNFNEINLPSLEDVIEAIKSDEDTPALPLSKNFWNYYELIKNYKSQKKEKFPEKSLPARALNMLKSLRDSANLKDKYIDFINLLIEDIIEYGTLSDYRLRQIANLEKKTDIVKAELDKLIEELGGPNYLEKIKLKTKEIKKEIIIAIENQK